MNKKFFIEHGIAFVCGMIGVGIISMLGTDYAILGGFLVGAYGHGPILKLIRKKNLVK